MQTENKLFLLALAKKAIKAKLENKNLELSTKKIPAELKQKRATFVTLTMNNKLRGCIGHLQAVQEIYKDVIDNAQAAAFSDLRFPPLSSSEFNKINIEISILSSKQKLKYSSPEFLIEYLAKNKPGVILSKNKNSATFLPQVWEELKNPQKFLSHLCLKAGLTADEWLKDVNIKTYTVEKI